MGDFLRDYGTQFALAIAGLNTAISLVIGQFFKDNPRARIALVVASVVLIGLGVGASFYSQYQIVSSANAERVQAAEQVQKRLATKNLLGSAIKDGESLVAKQRTESEDDANTYKSEAEAWANKTGQLIGDAYGDGEAELFGNNAGITMFNSPGHPSTLTRSWMSARIQRLNELMPRVDTIVMLKDFDPNKYLSK